MKIMEKMNIEKGREKSEIISRIGIPLLIFFILMFSVSYVSAYERVCLGYGDPYPDGRVCYHDLCITCQTDEGGPAHPGNCNDLPGACTIGGEGSVDVTPPEITVNSPVEGGVYSGRRVLFDIDSNEPASFYYIDNINGRGRWSRVAANTDDILKSISFKDGLNDITIKAIDVHNNEAFSSMQFYVDSKKPKIKGTLPKKGFSGGDFSVSFQEENPVSAILHYGVSGDMREGVVDIDNNCDMDRGTYDCDISVGLNDFDGSEIVYFFELTDLAGNVDTSKPLTLGVDVSDPIIDNLRYEKDGKKVNFYIEIDEAFLDEVVYSYDDRGKIKERKICSKLNDGICEGKASFKDGNWDIDVIVRDEAGNSVSQALSFLVDSKKPKIKSTSPKKGFASGEFNIEFVEGSPVSSVLYYGVSEDMREANVNLGGCLIDGEKYSCGVSVDLTDFEGEDITYWFSVKDVAENVVENKPVSLTVDLTYPVLVNSEGFWVQGMGKDNRYIYFDMEIDEDNLDEVSYIDWNDKNPKWKKLCSKLDSFNKCIKKKSFKKGVHDVDIQIIDEAGNAFGISVVGFEVV